LALRRDASALIAEGWSYSVAYALPLATLWTEAELIRERIHTRMSTEAVLLQAAVVDVVGGGGHLVKALEKLDE